MRLYNSLTRKLEEFRPINPSRVGIYTCGPTVYDFVTIGNWRTYTLGDLVYRSLKFLGFKPFYVMNITDVGHLTGDNLGDANIGEDRLEKAAKREGKTAWHVASFYTADFLEGIKKLNLINPDVLPKATDHISEQIDLIKKIEEKGLTYRIDDGIYFDVGAYEKTGNKYGELSTLDKIKEGARVEPNPQKRDPRDFALWKASKEGEKRQMEWESPWGVGFPGWHIECSAMSVKYLSEQFDIHIGGEDLRSIHHPNEIAQSEAATNKKPFVRYWLHGAFLLVDGGRMGKSRGNAYTLSDLEKREYSPLDLRYFYLTSHYRKSLNFTFEGLDAAKAARNKLKQLVLGFVQEKEGERSQLSKEKLEKIDLFREKFKAALENDLNMPEALAVVWEVTKSNIADYDKYELLQTFDEVLGLKITEKEVVDEADEMVTKMVNERETLRKQGRWAEADRIRQDLIELGFEVEDTQRGIRVVRRKHGV
ncbi:cysteine--tRNA ligase [Candidatus Collierbacteria bacterium]|nr:cysteine--tRNA ligase [Candidatus Collierbacteria bacterium]